MDRMKALPDARAEEHAGQDRAVTQEDMRASHESARPVLGLYDPFASLCTPQHSDHDFDHF